MTYVMMPVSGLSNSLQSAPYSEMPIAMRLYNYVRMTSASFQEDLNPDFWSHYAVIVLTDLSTKALTATLLPIFTVNQIYLLVVFCANKCRNNHAQELEWRCAVVGLTHLQIWINLFKIPQKSFRAAIVVDNYYTQSLALSAVYKGKIDGVIVGIFFSRICQTYSYQYPSISSEEMSATYSSIKSRVSSEAVWLATARLVSSLFLLISVNYLICSLFVAHPLGAAIGSAVGLTLTRKYQAERYWGEYWIKNAAIPALTVLRAMQRGALGESYLNLSREDLELSYPASIFDTQKDQFRKKRQFISMIKPAALLVKECPHPYKLDDEAMDDFFDFQYHPLIFLMLLDQFGKLGQDCLPKLYELTDKNLEDVDIRSDYIERLANLTPIERDLFVQVIVEGSDFKEPRLNYASPEDQTLAIAFLNEVNALKNYLGVVSDKLGVEQNAIFIEALKRILRPTENITAA